MMSPAEYPFRISVFGWLVGSLMIAQLASPACLRSIAREQLTLEVKGCQTVENLMMNSRHLANGDSAKLQHLNLLKPMPRALVLEASLMRREIILTASDEWASPEPFSNTSVYRWLVSKGDWECPILQGQTIEVVRTPKCCDVTLATDVACFFDLFVVEPVSIELPPKSLDGSGSAMNPPPTRDCVN